MRWFRDQSGRESTDYGPSVVLCGGWRAWPVDWCSDKDVGRSERKSRPLVQRTSIVKETQDEKEKKKGYAP